MCALFAIYLHLYRKGIFFWVGVNYDEHQNAQLIPTQALLMDAFTHVRSLLFCLIGSLKAVAKLMITLLQLIIEHWPAIVFACLWLTS